jgi:hypothetical protein
MLKGEIFVKESKNQMLQQKIKELEHRCKNFDVRRE